MRIYSCKILGFLFVFLGFFINLAGCDKKTETIYQDSYNENFPDDSYGQDSLLGHDKQTESSYQGSSNENLAEDPYELNGLVGHDKQTEISYLNPSSEIFVDDSHGSGTLEVANKSFKSITPLDVLFGDALDSRSISELDKEFLLNYSLLYSFYPFAHSDSLVPKGTFWYTGRLGKMDDYLDQGGKKLSFKIELYKRSEDIFYMYYSMNDDYTMYIPAEAMSFDEFIDEFEAREEVTDLGVNIHFTNSALVVMQTYVGSSARIGGIMVGDTILTVDGVQVSNELVFEKMSTGKVGKNIKLTVARNENGMRVEKEISLVLVSYVPPTVTYKIIDSIPVIHISEFAENNTPSDTGTYGEFLDALKATDGYKSTIIDLRGNLGGDVSMCEGVSAEMLGENETMYYSYESELDSITGKPVIMSYASVTKRDGFAKDRYFVFLADSNSASCSEITLVSVAGNKRYPIVGTTTHGKGIAYSIAPTYLGGTAMFTYSIVVDKNHQIYHTRGIDPDVFEANSTEALNKALAIAKEGTMVRVAGYSETVSPFYKYPGNYVAKKSIPSVTSKIPHRSELGMIKKFNSIESFKQRK